MPCEAVDRARYIAILVIALCACGCDQLRVRCEPFEDEYVTTFSLKMLSYRYVLQHNGTLEENSDGIVVVEPDARIREGLQSAMPDKPDVDVQVLAPGSPSIANHVAISIDHMRLGNGAALLWVARTSSDNKDIVFRILTAECRNGYWRITRDDYGGPIDMRQDK